MSATTFKISAGIYLIVVAMMSSAIGGFLAGRLRRHWAGVDVNEVYFRDTAHGFLSWAFATVLGAAVLGGAFTHITAGGAAGAGAATAAASSAAPAFYDVYVDRLLRTPTGAPGPTPQAELANARGELGRLIGPALQSGTDISATDRAYLARVIAARTGVTPADAEQRVAEVITQAKAAVDSARRATAQLAFWLAASMLAGALAASLAATEAGVFRDSRWYRGRAGKGAGRLTPFEKNLTYPKSTGG